MVHLAENTSQHEKPHLSPRHHAPRWNLRKAGHIRDSDHRIRCRESFSTLRSYAHEYWTVCCTPLCTRPHATDRVTRSSYFLLFWGHPDTVRPSTHLLGEEVRGEGERKDEMDEKPITVQYSKGPFGWNKLDYNPVYFSSLSAT
jgi:hypothetical protein